MTHPYATADYARSLPHVGRALSVPAWGAHVLVRPTPAGGREDATGPYPLCVLAPQADLAGGLEQLRAAGLVSLVLVAGEGLAPPREALESAFDFVRPFKTHYVYDRALGPRSYAKHHRYEVKRAHQHVAAREIRLSEHLDAWRNLYAELAARHAVGSLHAFPDEHHQTLARLEGVRAFGAFVEDRLVSAHVFVVDDGRAVSHLAASSPEGYARRAAYAVNDLAIEALDDCEVINFGGGAGFADDPADGLVRFKKGFSNTTAAAYLCGSVLDAEAYGALSAGAAGGAYFPAYRGPRQEGRSDAHQG
jgi:hypothetical protein